MNLSYENINDGILINFNNKEYKLLYPENIWKNYPKEIKEVLIDNLTYLLTANIPLIAKFDKINYNTSLPLFKYLFDSVIINSIPTAVDDYKDDAKERIKQFMNISYNFKDLNVKYPIYDKNYGKNYDQDLDERALIPLSCGKDSLLTLGVCNELKLKPVCVYINDTVSETENNLKLEHTKQICNNLSLNLVQIRNEIEQLNDFETWDKDETCLSYTHMITGFCFISLPILNYYKTKHIVLGNQKDMDFSFINKEGFKSYPAYDQKSEWTKQQDIMIKMMTNNKANVFSVIRPLTNIAIIYILNHRYPNLAKYQVSCDCLNASNEKRWCHYCNKCCRLYLFMKAFNFDVKNVGFHKDLLDKKYIKHYSMFHGKDVDVYEKSKEARDQQLLAFYMAYKNNVKGYLIEKFKKEFLEEAKEREKELYKKFFTIYKDVDMPKGIKENVLSIYKEELSNFT